MLHLSGFYSSSKWSIWNIEETEQQLLEMLDCKEWYQNILHHKSSQRRLEMLAVRVLLKTMLQKEVEIKYLPSGKPYLDNGIQLSITHTTGFVAVAISENNPVAIDIEQYSEKLRRVKNRFVLDSDYIDATQELKHLTLYWCTKEAVYKYIDNPEIDLLNDILLDNFSPILDIGKFKIQYKEKASILFEALYICQEQYAFVIIQKKSSQIN